MTYKEKNKALCEKYPFLLPRNRYTDEPLHGYDYEFTELDDMPAGWRIAFGEKMCAEIRDALVSKGMLEDYRIAQIKEKHGELAWYCNGDSDIMNIKRKYESMSRRTCIECGKPATRISVGWLSPYCEGCAPEGSRSLTVVDDGAPYDEGDE